MAEPNNFPIGILLFIIVTLTALGYLLLAYSINIWPFASKPTCDNIDGNGKSFTCTTGTTLKSGVTCATSPCTEKECCTDTNTPTPPPPPPPTPPIASCQKTTQGGDGWNAIKGCVTDCENLEKCSDGGTGTRQCYRWVPNSNSCKQVANPVEACFDQNGSMKNDDECSKITNKGDCESCAIATLDCCEPVS